MDKDTDFLADAAQGLQIAIDAYTQPEAAPEQTEILLTHLSIAMLVVLDHLGADTGIDIRQKVADLKSNLER